MASVGSLAGGATGTFSLVNNSNVSYISADCFITISDALPTTAYFKVLSVGASGGPTVDMTLLNMSISLLLYDIYSCDYFRDFYFII